MSFKRTLEQAILNYVFRGVDPSLPANLYFGLATAAPTVTAAGTEISWTGYARVSKARNTSNFSAAAYDSGDARNEVRNAAEIDFGTAGASVSGNAVAIVVYDAASGGNELAWADLPSSKVIQEDDTVKIPVDNLTFFSKPAA